MKNIFILKKLILSCGLITLTAHAGNKLLIPDMVTIPGGKFMMGSELERESPKHLVKIASFKLAKYEVTVGEFKKFIKDTNHKTRDICWIWQEKTSENNWGMNRLPGNWKTPQYAQSDKHPVMCVTYNDAKAYAKWLNNKTGRSFRLPTEAEWEYAARAGAKTDRLTHNDQENICKYANILDIRGAQAITRDYNLTLEGANCDDGSEYTSAVGSYEPNYFGLYDMIGNVKEYVEDCEHKNYKGAPTDGSAWNTGCNTDRPMIIKRGSSYGSNIRFATFTARGHAGLDNPSAIGEGFRLAESIN